MSFLGGGRNAAPTGGVNAEKMEMAITEYVHGFTTLHMTRSSGFLLYRLDTVTDFFNRMVQCVYRLKDLEILLMVRQVMSR
jgi:hypothetical protein